MTGCDECDDQNVMHPDTLHYAARDLHRARHELTRPFEQFAARLIRAIDGTDTPPDAG